MRAEHGNTFLCSYWPIYLKVTSFKAEGNSSKKRWWGKTVSSHCLLPAQWEEMQAWRARRECKWWKHSSLLLMHLLWWSSGGHFGGATHGTSHNNELFGTLNTLLKVKACPFFFFFPKIYVSTIHAKRSVTKPWLCTKEPTPTSFSPVPGHLLSHGGTWVQCSTSMDNATSCRFNY